MSSIDHEWRKRKVLYDALSQEELSDEFNAVFESVSGNKRFVKSMVDKEGVGYLQYASAKLTGDREFMSELANELPWALEYCSDELKADKEFVMPVVRQKGSALQFASESLKSDKDVVKAAVSQYGRSIEHANERFLSDGEIAKIAVENDNYSLPWFSKEIQLDPDIGLKALSRSGDLLRSLKDEVKDSEQAVLIAASNDTEALRWTTNRLWNDKEFVLKVFKAQRANERYGGHVGTTWANQEIIDICGDKDPIKALESHIAHEKLQSTLSHKAPSPKQSRSLKL